MTTVRRFFCKSIAVRLLMYVIGEKHISFVQRPTSTILLKSVLDICLKIYKVQSNFVFFAKFTFVSRNLLKVLSLMETCLKLFTCWCILLAFVFCYFAFCFFVFGFSAHFTARYPQANGCICYFVTPEQNKNFL